MWMILIYRSPVNICLLNLEIKYINLNFIAENVLFLMLILDWTHWFKDITRTDTNTQKLLDMWNLNKNRIQSFANPFNLHSIEKTWVCRIVKLNLSFIWQYSCILKSMSETYSNKVGTGAHLLLCLIEFFPLLYVDFQSLSCTWHIGSTTDQFYKPNLQVFDDLEDRTHHPDCSFYLI